jgi:hypothetical protein
MRFLLIPLAACLMSSAAWGQSAQSKLDAAFTKADQFTFGQELDFMLWFANQGYLINDMTGKDLSEYVDINSIAKKPGFTISSDINPADFNPFFFGFETNPDRPSVYRIGESNMTVFFYSDAMARDMFNRSQRIKNNQSK